MNEAGIREEMVPKPNGFASEGEYREYLQDQEERRRAGYDEPPHAQAYEPGYAHAQGYAEQYADAAYPGGSSYPASGPPEYATPAHAQDGGALASGGPARGDGKYGYVPR